MWYKLIPKPVRRHPLVKKTLFRSLYNLSYWLVNRWGMDLRFLNLGYIYEGQDAVVLQSEKNPESLCVQLYEYILSHADITDKRVLEVGSGRGGGSNLMKESLKAATVIGLDISDANIKYSKRSYKLDNLNFVRGDAEKIPFPSGTFDVVVNIESSHCYPRKDVFVKNAYSVLKKGCCFLWADLLDADMLSTMEEHFTKANFEVQKKEDITTNVLKSIEVEEARKRKLTPKKYLKLKPIRESLVTLDSSTYAKLQSGEKLYYFYVLKK